MLFLVFMAIPIRTSLPYVVVATERSSDDLWLKTKFHTNRSGGKYKPVLIDGRWFVVDIFADEKTISNSNCISKFHLPSPPPAPSSSTNTVKRAPKTDSDYG